MELGLKLDPRLRGDERKEKPNISRDYPARALYSKSLCVKIIPFPGFI